MALNRLEETEKDAGRGASFEFAPVLNYTHGFAPATFIGSLASSLSKSRPSDERLGSPPPMILEIERKQEHLEVPKPRARKIKFFDEGYLR